jgi:predicted RND superfamily exporter protein
MPIISDPKGFDRLSGNFVERLVFNHRIAVMILCAVCTVIFSFQAGKLVINASFDRLIPQSHRYITNYFDNRDELKSLGNSIRIVVESTDGDIWNKDYLYALMKVNDAIYLTPGIDRSYQRSLWMSAVRWTEVTEEGFRGGPVMPADYDGTQKSIDELRANVARSGIVGALVANDFKSSMIVVPVIDAYADTGAKINYGVLGKQLEKVRAIETTPFPGTDKPPKVRIRIVGFSKMVGDLMEGLVKVMTYFGIAAAVAIAVIYGYTRCARSTALVVTCSLVAVFWQLGIVQILGYELDPYSVLVPFLIFAIGVSHGAQKMNGIMQDVGRGTHRYVAARYTFRRLFIAGLTALLADAVGFAVLMLIDIPVIQDMALAASIGVAILAFTNLLLLPVLLSYVGVSPSAAKRSLRYEQQEGSSAGLWDILNKFTERRWATGAIVVAIALGIGGYAVSTKLQIGDLDAGAPELRPNSRYNLDNAYIISHYGLSSDQFAVIAKTAPGDCEKPHSLMELDRLGWHLQQVHGVQTTASLADEAVRATAGMFEGSPKWYTVSHDPGLAGTAVQRSQERNRDLLNNDCSVVPLIAYLEDHKADTLARVLSATEQFAAAHDSAEIQFLPAAGSAGIEAITNIVVKKANISMMLYVYAAVSLLCFISFRNWRAVIVAILPLVLTSVLGEALMVMLGIGVKVATLPVIALGVGIGVDYALYLLSVQISFMRAGDSLSDAYRHAIRFTGRVVALVGVTLAGGVVTWAWSPIKFQADMGILLTFMFLLNMVGALILIPALSHFLLPRIKR